MSREVKVGILVTAETKGAEQRLESFGKNAKKLGETMSKTGAVMNVASGALGGIGGAGAQAASQITGLIGSVAAGGPLAAGLAAITGILAGGRAVWQAYTFDAEQAKIESEDFAKALGSKLDAATQKSAALVAALGEKLAGIREAMAPGLELADKQRRLGNLELAQIRETNDAVRATNANKIANLTAEIDAQSKVIAATGLQKLKTIEAAQAEKARAEAIDATAKAEEMRLAATRRAWEAEKRGRLEQEKMRQADAEMEISRQNDIENAKLRAIGQSNMKIEQLSQSRINAIQKSADRELEIAKQTDAAELELRQSTTQALTGLANSLVDTAMADHSKMTAAERAAARELVAAKTAVSIAGAVAAGASVPYPGNIAAIVSGIAAVVAGLAQIASYATGGFVGGGVSGRDSVAARVMPGEYVMSRGEVSAFSTMLRRFDAGPGAQAALAPMVSGSQAAPSMGGGRAPIIINQRTELKTWRPDSVAMARMTQDQARSVAALRLRGALPGWAG